MTVYFLIDENLPYALEDLLRARGHRADHLKRIGRTGITNGEVYDLGEAESAWIVTRDADFQNMERFLRRNPAGVVLFKLTDTRTPAILKSMENVLDRCGDQLDAKHLVIVEDGGIRVY